MRRNPIPENAYEQAIEDSERGEARDSAAAQELRAIFCKTLLAGAKDKLPTPGRRYFVSGYAGPMTESAPVSTVMGDLFGYSQHDALQARLFALIGAAANGWDIEANAVLLVNDMAKAYAECYCRDHELSEEDDFDIAPVEMSAWGGE